jgi:predicted nucleic acid-binding protein
MTAFFDTNVLVYAFANDEAKRSRAQQILAEGGVISVQVVNEFANVLHKKQRQEWPRIEAALAVVENWFEIARPLTIDTHHAALALARDHGLSLYDALIVAAALETGCAKLYSEDFQHGRRFGELAIVDPFKEP